MNSLSAGFVPPQGKLFYIVQNGQSKVREIRTVVEINGMKKYRIDRKKNQFGYVSMSEFYAIPTNCNMQKID